MDALPIAGVNVPTRYSLPLVGKRVRHKHLPIAGRLNDVLAALDYIEAVARLRGWAVEAPKIEEAA